MSISPTSDVRQFVREIVKVWNYDGPAFRYRKHGILTFLQLSKNNVGMTGCARLSNDGNVLELLSYNDNVSLLITLFVQTDLNELILCVPPFHEMYVTC